MGADVAVDPGVPAASTEWRDRTAPRQRVWMRGGSIVSLDGDFFRHVESVLVEMGATIASDGPGESVVQLTDEGGRLFTVFEGVPAGTEWEVTDGPFEAADDSVRVPAMAKVFSCSFECRWIDLAVRLLKAVPQDAEASMWVVDGNGVVWDANRVDPQRIVLRGTLEIVVTFTDVRSGAIRFDVGPSANWAPA